MGREGRTGGKGPHEPDAVCRALVDRHQAGDRRAFPLLYARHESYVLGYLSRALGNPHDAEDVAQLVALKVFRGLTGYRPGPAPFRAWVARIAQNTLRDHQRRRDHGTPTPPDELDARIDAAGDVLELDANEWARAAELHRAFDQLCRSQQQVLELFFRYELSDAEAALLLRRSTAATTRARERALAALRVRLDNSESVDAPTP